MPSTIQYARRVHIAPVGFEIDRVVLPVIEMEADKVWLMTERDPERDLGKIYLDKIQDEIKEKNSNCDVVVKRCDFFTRDLYDVLRAFREIMELERGNHIFVNVSTGTKIHAIAGMMACMIFKDLGIDPVPYYAKPDTYLPLPQEGIQISNGCVEIQQLPNYRIERPTEEQIKMLIAINECCSNASKNITKRELIRELRKRDLLKLSTSDGKTIRNEKVAFYLALQRKCLEPLRKWNFIEIRPPSNRGKIHITNEGKNMLKFLEY
jgi:hypothetical protein